MRSPARLAIGLVVAALPAAAQTELRIVPVAPGATEGAPLAAGAVTTQPGPVSRLGPVEDVPATRLEMLTAPVSRVVVEPFARSNAVVAALPISRVTTEPLASSAISAAQLRAELGAVETERGLLVSLPGDVLFDFDESDIRRDARPVLAKLAELIELTPEAMVLIEGHTDARGSDSYNRHLSERRAAAVAAWLAERHGVPRDRLREAGRGEGAPVAPNARPDGGDDPEGRQRNRRVEVIFQSG